MSALGSISSLLSSNGKPSQDARIAIFSDALNHASIIDGIRLVERLQEAKVFVYKHGDMVHLNTLLYVTVKLNLFSAHKNICLISWKLFSTGQAARLKKKLSSLIRKLHLLSSNGVAL